jgi:tetratricopeptide (TPR) repeat protein
LSAESAFAFPQICHELCRTQHQSAAAAIFTPQTTLLQMRNGSTAYNHPVVYISNSSRLRRMGQLTASAALALALALSASISAHAQAPAAGGRILLVLPFDNRTGQPSLEWIREAAAEILSRRFSSAGFAPMSRADRRYALDHLGLPQGFHPSRASSLKLAETVDADSIIVGSYLTDGTGIVVEAQVVDVPHLRMSQPITARGEMRDLIAVFGTLAWKLTRELDPGFSVAQETFVAAGAGLSLGAFEQYIRGITEPDQGERLRHLNQAVQLNPEFSQAWMALGREDYDGQKYEDAAAAFAKVGGGDPDALVAGFYRGLSLMFSGDYAKAEEAFGSVARVLPLAEVVNNEGVALSRMGKDGIPFYRQAIAADPNAADYHFNLAVSMKRRGESAEALTELTQCLRLRPNDTEAQDINKAWRGLTPAPAPGEEAEPKADPLERIARTFDAQAFRQAAQMMDQVEASRLAALTPRDRAQKLCSQAKDFLGRGLLLEAERLYQSAIAADGKLAEAHAGLAEVRERTGDAQGARNEAHVSIQLAPSAEAYLVLGRLDLAAGRPDEAGKDAGEAQRLDPQSKAAQDLRGQIEAKQGQKQ